MMESEQLHDAMQIQELSVPAAAAGERLDKWLAGQALGLTRSAVQDLISRKYILADGREIAKNYRMQAGAVIRVCIPEPEPLQVLPQEIPLDIVYEDADLLVVNKPKGMVVHPAAGNYDNTLVNALLYHCKGSLSGINGVIRPGIVHRLDKNTSGLLIVAKTDQAHRSLAAQIQAHSFTREYEAIATGSFAEPVGEINAPIGRSTADRKKMCVTERHARPAVTHYEVIRQYGGLAHVRLRLETGRTHQIRVHLAYIGHPVYADDVYGKQVKGIQGQCLHARKIGFIHPVTEAYLEFEQEAPAYFQKLLHTFEKY